eukprot:4341658-Prymnesium_polylepis.2
MQPEPTLMTLGAPSAAARWSIASRTVAFFARLRLTCTRTVARCDDDDPPSRVIEGGGVIVRLASAEGVPGGSVGERRCRLPLGSPSVAAASTGWPLPPGGVSRRMTRDLVGSATWTCGRERDIDFG